MIGKRGNLYYVVSEKGKPLSVGLKTRAAAVKRLRQVEYYKKRNKNRKKR